ncbi:hypothetical protein EV368DRAFT_43203 [Lentinula lateritia]|nr:hypothetical protein EV368DRAFT_43203 [Lentinula lateritia]
MNKVWAEREWKKLWKVRPVRGCFAIANQIPPLLKPTAWLEDTPRELFGHLMQCRTGHAYTGEYYSQFSPHENVNCPCGEELQTREHILRACPKYRDHQYILQKVFDDICLKDILGTSKGIEALTKFLDESGAFTRMGRC